MKEVKKRIFFVITYISRNGPSRVIENMIYGLDKTKYEIYIITFLANNDQKYQSFLEKQGVKNININLRNRMEILLRAKKELDILINDYLPDVIHSHGILPDIINAQLVGYYGVRVSTIHNNMYEDYLYSYGKILGNLFILWHQYYLKKMDKCIGCSKTVFDGLKHQLGNLTFVRNSIYRNQDIRKENNFNKLRYELGISADDTVYIYIGNLSKLKNVKFLIEQFNDLLCENEYFLLLGAGAKEEQLKSLATNENIKFLGFKNNVDDYLKMSDIYCSASTSEGFSIAVLEALENGNYLLLSDIPSHKEIFEIEKKVYIGENFSENNFSEKKKILSAKLKEKDVTKIQEFLKENLSVYTMMEKYVQIYDNLKQNKGE